MKPARERYYRGLFLVATVYDVALGIIFTFFYKAAFDLLDIRDQLPEGGYVPLIGAFLFVIGVGGSSESGSAASSSTRTRGSTGPRPRLERLGIRQDVSDSRGCSRIG